MKRQDSSPGAGNRGPGCLASVVAVAGVVVLAPMAAMVRAIRSWRRGGGIRIRREHTPFADATVRIDLDLDVPPEMKESCGRSLTDAVVRIAEALRRPDDVYHLIYREHAADESTVLPVGPLLQELGERFHLVLFQEALASRTCVWLTLARDKPVVQMLDPFEYDPEGSGEPEALLARSGMRWGMASTVAADGASVLFRLALFVPEQAVGRIDALLDRLAPTGD